MARNLPTAATAAVLLALISCGSAVAQKAGGILKMYHFDSPASLSLHEEVTLAALGPAMGLFNNLVMFDQHVPQAGLSSIMPDLATEWSWGSSKTELRFRLHKGVKWHAAGHTSLPLSRRCLTGHRPGQSSARVHRAAQLRDR